MYVFGIDLPIMEFLFIFSVLFCIAAAVIWLEIKRLRTLILSEKADIYRFEQDISKLEPHEKEKHCKSLREFIKTSLEKGFRKADIKGLLKKKGWPADLIEASLKKVK